MRPRILRWELPDTPPPKRPFRDSLLMYLVFAIIIVVVAWLTHGDVGRAAVVAGLFFVVATGWSWWKWKQRLDRDRRRAEEAPARETPPSKTTPPA